MQIPALLYISRKFYRCWGQMMVHCQNPVRTQLLTHAKSATICSCHRIWKKGCMVIQSTVLPLTNQRTSHAAGFSRNASIAPKDLDPRPLSWHNQINPTYKCYCTNMTRAIKRNTVSLFGCLFFSLGFLLLCLGPFYLFFFPLAHIQYITSYYHTAMCLCQRQAKEI